MGIVTRYFSTASAGAADGTTWADRAVLFSGGAWSAVITGFNFSGADSLLCLIGPGSHAITASLAAGSFANAPTVANQLYLHGCDSSGVALTPPSPGWASCQSDWSTGSLPVLSANTNIAMLNLGFCQARLLKFTAANRTGGSVVTLRRMDWCSVENSASNSSASGVSLTGSNNSITNSILKCSGTAYNFIATLGVNQFVRNCRLVGVTGSSGNRTGLQMSTSTAGPLFAALCTVYGCGGAGVLLGSSTNQTWSLHNCVIANNGGDGVTNAGTGLISDGLVAGCMITGNGGYGVNGNSNYVTTLGNRLRTNTSGNFNGTLNHPTSFDNYTTSDSDANEYVDAPGAGDFRILLSALNIWGKGYGVRDQAYSGGYVIGG